jgi:glycosyltransferase involved in cell wall biosynthesis
MHPVSTSDAAENRPDRATPSKAVRVAYFVSHPIQYQAPLLRRIAQEPDIDLTVFYSSDLSVRGYKDAGFGVHVQWDIPLLEGYKYEFLPRVADGDVLGFAKPLNWGIFHRLRKGTFDAAWVFGYSRLVCLQAIIAAAALRLPVIIRSDSSLFDRTRSRMILIAKSVFLRSLRPALTSAVAIGKGNTEYWKRYLGSDFPVFSMPYAIDNDFYRRKVLEGASRRESYRLELGLQPGHPVILFASKLLPGKRCIDLVEACLRLTAIPESYPPPYLLIVGDGQERASLEARVRASGSSRIRFLGFRNQTELPRLYDLADVCVLPSQKDAWGLVVNEAMIAAKPVIVTNRVGCYPDLVHPGVNGFVYPVFDVPALAECLRRLLADPELRATMGENSLRIIQQYSFEQDVAGLRQALAHAVPGFPAESAACRC